MFERAKKLIEINTNLLKRSFQINRFKRQHNGNWDVFDLEVQTKTSPVFVLSTGRCGTEFLTKVLSLNNELLVHHSPSPQLIYADRLAFEKGNQDFLQGALIASRFQLISESMMRKKRFVETNHRATFFATSIVENFPNAKFIHLVRSPKAFLKSGMKLGFYKNRHNDYSRIRHQNIKIWNEYEQYEKILWLWNETNSFIEDFKVNRGKTEVITVYSEELFVNPAVAKQVMDFCSSNYNLNIKKLRALMGKKVNAKVSEKHKVKSFDESECVRNAYKKGILNSADTYPGLNRYKPDDI